MLLISPVLIILKVIGWSSQLYKVIIFQETKHFQLICALSVIGFGSFSFTGMVNLTFASVNLEDEYTVTFTELFLLPWQQDIL